MKSRNYIPIILTTVFLHALVSCKDQARESADSASSEALETAMRDTVRQAVNEKAPAIAEDMAREALRDIQRNASQATYPSGKQMTKEAFLEEWLKLGGAEEQVEQIWEESYAEAKSSFVNGVVKELGTTFAEAEQLWESPIPAELWESLHNE